MNDPVTTDPQTELAGAAGQINVARHVEIEQNNIETINDQIRGLDARNAWLEENIEACQDTVRDNRKEIKRNLRQQDRLRLQRDIFEESAMRLRRANHP